MYVTQGDTLKSLWGGLSGFGGSFQLSASSHVKKRRTGVEGRWLVALSIPCISSGHQAHVFLGSPNVGPLAMHALPEAVLSLQEQQAWQKIQSSQN